MATTRFWYPSTLRDRGLTDYLLSFRIAEEATWDHRFHDLGGNELDPSDLRITQHDFGMIQLICDSVVGAPLALVR